jgi:hypothetical protein
MPRSDLTESDIRALQGRAGRVVDDDFTWTLTKREADQVRRLAGEVVRLRESESQVKHMEGQEQEW